MPTYNTLPDGYSRDRNGFPIGPCNRCGGSGRYSWCQMYGDRCFGCGGTGKRFMVPKHHAAWRDAVRAAVRVNAQDLRPGDTVRPWGARDDNGRPLAGRTVAYVEVTDEPCGWSAVGADATEFGGRPTSEWPDRLITGWYTLVWWAPDPASTVCGLADDECFGDVVNERCARHADEPAEPERVAGNTMFHREGVSVDPAPYVAKAERGLAYLLARRS